jgi:hypothetical protein
MNSEAKVAATSDLLEELVSSRQEADTKPKIAPVHVLNDVSATMAKINREVCPCDAVSRDDINIYLTCQLDALHARTGFEVIVFGVRSSADHYTAPIVHSTSSKIPTYFDVVIKKPVTDRATSIEAFCLSGVDGESASSLPETRTLTGVLPGVIGKLVQNESQLRSEVVALINKKLRTSSPIPGTQQIHLNSRSRNDLKGGSKSHDIQELRHPHYTQTRDHS